MEESEASDYRYCIANQLPLPEELITWFHDQADLVVTGDRSARISVTIKRYRLGYAPQEWHEILEDEGRG